MLRYLRIAASVLCVTACVLLVALWVRSYCVYDLRSHITSRLRFYVFESFEGQVRVAIFDLQAAAWEPGSVTVPYWLAVSITGMGVTILLMRRPYRFSLRTLLIATTLIAVVLGLVVAFPSKAPTTPPYNHILMR